MGGTGVIEGHNDVRTIVDNGQDIVIEGHHLEVLVSGNSGRVTISGHHNQVVLDHVSSIDAPGHHNQIVYKSGQPALLNKIYFSKGEPVVDKSGLGNEIIRR